MFKQYELAKPHRGPRSAQKKKRFFTPFLFSLQPYDHLSIAMMIGMSIVAITPRIRGAPIITSRHYRPRRRGHYHWSRCEYNRSWNNNNRRGRTYHWCGCANHGYGCAKHGRRRINRLHISPANRYAERDRLLAADAAMMILCRLAITPGLLIRNAERTYAASFGSNSQNCGQRENCYCNLFFHVTSFLPP